MSSKIKVYELAKELNLDSQHLVDQIQRLGIDIKNPMNVLGTEEVRTVREHYRKNRPATSSKSSPATPTRSNVTEKRVGATVIRRRSKAADSTPAPVEEETPVEAVEVIEEPAPVALTEEEIVEFQANPDPNIELIEIEVDAPVEIPVVEAAAPEMAEQGENPKAEVKPAPVVAPEPEKKIRRVFKSIIKKVATEEYLGEKIGPKLAPRPPTPKPVKKETVVKPGGTGVARTDLSSMTSLGLKRVKEIELIQAEVAKEAKRRLMERQDIVFRSSDYLKRELVHSTKKKKTVINRPAMKTVLTKPAKHKLYVEMASSITVSELAKGMGVKAPQVISKLMGLGVTAAMNQTIDFDTATLVAHEFNHEVRQKLASESDFIPTVDTNPEKMKPRAPVVTIMGHVDHGKTSLLDAIRKTKVAAGEAGGITQHIGAYTVNVAKGKITFLDTPGHEAFTAMRKRGAKATDLVILVVSAVDGVMPQTLESISHAKAGSVPIIVAVNKIDLPDANPDRIKQTLAGHDLNPEEWGGDTIYVNVSAKTGKGIDQLLESILLQAEMLELKANYDVLARGTIIESRLDKFRGPIASLLVQHGHLKVGDVVVCGNMSGKVKAMTNSLGQKVTEALPSDPVELLGLPEVPNVGDEIFVVEDEKAAKGFTQLKHDRETERILETTRPRLTLEQMLAAGADNFDGELKLILRSDVQGSSEALKEALTKFPQTKVRLKLLHSGTGGITESDVMLAAASDATIMGFNVRPDGKAQKLADAEGVKVRTYNIIYDLLEDAKKLLEGLVESEVKEKVIGRAEVRSVFHIPKVGAIAGSAVIDGKVVRGCYMRLLRDSRVVYEGKISSLKRFKEDVKEVAQGFECGIGLDNFNDMKTGDQFEAFMKEETKGTL